MPGMQKNNKIFFQLWNAGLINQVMSLELAVGLAEETGNQVIVHYCCHDLDKKGLFLAPVLIVMIRELDLLTILSFLIF
jgi:hypothetical protein